MVKLAATRSAVKKSKSTRSGAKRVRVRRVNAPKTW